MVDVSARAAFTAHLLTVHGLDNTLAEHVHLRGCAALMHSLRTACSSYLAMLLEQSDVKAFVEIFLRRVIKALL